MKEIKVKTTKTVSLDVSFVREVMWLADAENPERLYSNFSQALEKLAGIGMFVMRQSDDAGLDRFRASMEKVVQSERMMEWLQTLSPSQRHGIREMITMVEDSRQTRLVP